MPFDKLYDVVYKEWKKKKLVVLGELLEMLDCSVITVRRRLKEWNAISSYNKNGKYYTLPDIAKFDNYGLWFYKDIGFSTNGNLIQTIIHLVSSSVAGLFGEEIFGLLHLNSYTVLSKMINKSYLHREKMFGKYIYFSENKDVYSRQLRERIILNEQQSVKLLSNTVGVIVLVEFILNPELKPSEISRRLSNKGVNVTESLISNFFAYHGILKKTRDFQQL